MMFCHDATRYVLFLPGLRKADFAEIGGTWFRPLYLATLAMLGCPDTQIKKIELALGPMRFDTATDRSAQGSLRVAKQDLEAWLYRVPNVMDLNPLAMSCHLNERPATVYGAGGGGAAIGGGGATGMGRAPNFIVWLNCRARTPCYSLFENDERRNE